MLNFVEINNSRVICRNILGEVTFDTNRKYLTSAGEDVLGQAVVSFIPRGKVQTYTVTNNSWHSCMPATECFTWDKIESCHGIIGAIRSLFSGFKGIQALLSALTLGLIRPPSDFYYYFGTELAVLLTLGGWGLNYMLLGAAGLYRSMLVTGIIKGAEFVLNSINPVEVPTHMKDKYYSFTKNYDLNIIDLNSTLFTMGYATPANGEELGKPV